jgi:hypothetical protein
MKVKKTYKIALVVIILLVLVRIALPFIVENYVNKVLSEMPDYTGHVEDVDLSLYRGAYTIENLVLHEREKQREVPFMEIKKIDLSVEWGALLKGAVAGEVIIQSPRLNFVAEEAKEEAAEDTPMEEKEHWTETLKDLLPLTINRFEITDGKISYLDFNTQPQVNIYLNNLHLLAHNLSNVEETGEELPSSLRLNAQTLGGGLLDARMKLNALKEIPDFDLNLQLKQVQLPELNDFIKAYGKFDIERGRFELYSEIKLKNGQLTGYLKPFFEDLKVLNWEKDRKEGNFFQAVWEGIAGLFTEAVENQARDQIASRVPVKGSVNEPGTEVFTTILNILKNAFIEAFEKGIEHTVEE